MITAYKLAGLAHASDASFIPSLIGVREDQRTPGSNDTYFEQIDLDDFDPTAVTLVERTRMVSYDSLPLEVRDPILTIRGKGFGFYITASEAFIIARAAGDADFLIMLNSVTGSLERGVAA